jgi:hypothetical protein
VNLLADECCDALMNPADSAAKLARLRHLLRHHAHRLPGSFVVLDAKKARFRSLSIANP